MATGPEVQLPVLMVTKFTKGDPGEEDKELWLQEQELLMSVERINHKYADHIPIGKSINEVKQPSAADDEDEEEEEEDDNDDEESESHDDEEEGDEIDMELEEGQGEPQPPPTTF